MPIISTKRMVWILALVTASAVPSAPAQTPSHPTRTILVLDASGSMWGQVEGRAKIEIAREVIGHLVDQLPADTELGLVAYGHRHKGDCEDIELLLPADHLDRDAFKKTVNAIQPKGKTPLTSAVIFAAESLRFTEQEATVILVTDGEETCEKDPCEAAQILEATGVNFTAHVVAFDLDDKSAQSIECLAKTTGGLFLKADNASTLSDALHTVIEPTPEPSPEPPTEATVAGPQKVLAGSVFEVTWTGPNHKADYITIVPKDFEDSKYARYEYTRSGSPLKLTSIIDAGPAEIRYMHGPSRKVLARADILVEPAEVTLKGPKTIVAGGSVTVEWTGPNNKNDFITIVPKDFEDGKYARYEYTKKGSPLQVEAPVTPGPCEIRYQSEQGGKVLARADILVEPAEVTLKAPETIVAGGSVTIEWTGPNNKNDFITIVPKDFEDGKYARYEYTKKGSPLKVEAPVTAGPCEIRYQAEQGGKVLARIDLEVEPAVVTLKAPAEAPAGSKVTIEWTGPNNKNDFITIVPKDFEDGKYARYEYTKRGSPLKVEAPEKPGDCEVRYHTGQGGKVVNRAAIKITPKE